MHHESTRSLTAFTLITLFSITAFPGAGTAQQADLPEFNGQEVIVLDRELAVQIALDRSYRMELGRYGLQRQEYNLAASRAALKSNASASFTIPDFDQSIKEIISPSTGNPLVLKTKAARYSGSISIRQPLPTDGVVSLNGVINRSTDELFTYSPDSKNYFSRVFLRFEQPILQPNEIKNDIRRAELDLEETRLGFQDEEIRIATTISRSFFELFEMTHESLVAEEEVVRLEEMYRIGQQLYEAETLSEVNLLQLEVNLATSRNQASANTGSLERQKDDFKQEIGLPVDTEIELDPSMEFTPAVIDEDAMIEKALAQRTDLLRTLMRREEHYMELRERRAYGRLTGDVSVTLGLEGRGTEMEELYEAMSDPDQARGVAVNFNLPIWDWGRNKARVASQQTEIDQNYRTEEEQLRTIRREVSSAAARVREAESRLNLLRPSMEAASRSYQLALEQFRAGELNVQDMLLAQNQVSESDMSYLGAFLDYQRALVDLEAVTTGSGYGGRFRY